MFWLQSKEIGCHLLYTGLCIIFIHFNKNVNYYYIFISNRFPAFLYKRLCSAYDLSRKDAIIWGVCHEKVALEKYRTFGDAVVEPTGLILAHLFKMKIKLSDTLLLNITSPFELLVFYYFEWVQIY